MFTSHSVTNRHLQTELMDQPGLDADRHHQALRGLGRINLWSRTADTLWKPIHKLQRERARSLRILDIASGGGDVLCRLARKAKKLSLSLEFSGCDMSPVAVEYARANARRSELEIDFYVANVLEASLPEGFDVIMCSLFLHHLSEQQAVYVLEEMCEKARHLVLVNDLLRSSSGLVLAHVATRLLSMSPVVHVDGPRSVEGAFNRAEVSQLAERAGFSGAEIYDCWPQRFLLSWHKDNVPC